MRRPRIDEALTQESADELQLIPGDVVSWDLDMTAIGYELDFMIVTDAGPHLILGGIIGVHGGLRLDRSYHRLDRINHRQVRFVQYSTGNIVLLGDAAFTICGNNVVEQVHGTLKDAFVKVMQRRHARRTNETR